MCYNISPADMAKYGMTRDIRKEYGGTGGVGGAKRKVKKTALAEKVSVVCCVYLLCVCCCRIPPLF